MIEYNQNYGMRPELMKVNREEEFAKSVSNELIMSFTPEERLYVLDFIRNELQKSLEVKIDELEHRIKYDSEMLNILKKTIY